MAVGEVLMGWAAANVVRASRQRTANKSHEERIERFMGTP
jgi:hypothetical protein